MEEDIEKIEKIINRCKECEFVACETCEIVWNEVQALENLITRYKELEEENEEYEATLDIFDNREYRKRYLEERRKEEPNLLYPDADEIYKRYYDLLEECKKHPIKLTDEEYKKVIENAQKDCIPKSKIEEYMDKIQKELDKRKVKGMYIAVDGDIADTDINTWIIQRATLKELLESEENK